jgi:CRISPR-associated endonuclease/helicase Cas3
MTRPLAHSANAGGVSHDLERHLQDVASRCRSFAEKPQAAELGYWAGLWHDLGKYHPEFQAYLANPAAGRGPDHSSAGMVLADCYWRGLAFLVAGHHAGLSESAKLKGRLGEKKADPMVREALEAAGRALAPLLPAEPIADLLPAFLQEAGPRAGAARNQELFLRLLFSALVDADFLDTEKHFQPDRAAGRGRSPSLVDLWRRFEGEQSRFSGREETPLQRARHEIYQACLAAAELPPGLFRLTVPTGGGKTRSGMAFALRHALRHLLDRIIVAIPYTSIIEQTADVYREILGDLSDGGLLEHHSAVGDRDDAGSPVTAEQQWARLASENWDAPVVVTTTVQLFESLFAHRPAKCRKLHNIARSVLILDEVQTLPPHLLDPILDVLAQLVRYYGVTAVLCTATQPALTSNRYLKGLTDVREIVPGPERYFQTLKRVHYA